MCDISLTNFSDTIVYEPPFYQLFPTGCLGQIEAWALAPPDSVKVSFRRFYFKMLYFESSSCKVNSERLQ